MPANPPALPSARLVAALVAAAALATLLPTSVYAAGPDPIPVYGQMTDADPEAI